MAGGSILAGGVLLCPILEIGCKAYGSGEFDSPLPVSSSIGDCVDGLFRFNGLSSTRENFRSIACKTSLFSLSVLELDTLLDGSRERLKYEGWLMSPVTAGVILGV